MASDDKTPLNDTEGKPDYSAIFGEKKEEFAKQTVFGEVCPRLAWVTSPSTCIITITIYCACAVNYTEV